MLCKQVPFDPIPTTLKQEILSFAEQTIRNKDYDLHGNENKFGAENFKGGGAVGFTRLPEHLKLAVMNLVKDHPYFKNLAIVKLQLVTDASYVPPHIDPPGGRNYGINYMLQLGGENVTTSWWNLKSKYSTINPPDTVFIPYYMLDKIEEYCLEEDCAYELEFQKIHSVENLTGTRLSLAFLFHQ